MVRHFVAVPPLRSGGLVGRTDLIRRAVDLLMREEDVAFVGLGGVGKSALASALVRDEAVSARFPEGVFWLSVGKTEAGIPTWRLQLLDWARALDMPKDRIVSAEATGIEKLCELVHHGLGPARSLLVFDDVWEAQDALLLKDLGAECRRILTTRIGRLASGFSASGLLQVDDLSDADAQELFDRLAPTVAHQRPKTSQSCISVVGRLPLVVVIVASYLQASVTEDPTCLDDALNEVLDVRRRLELAPEMPKSSLTLLPEGTAATLDAVIGLSARRLSPEDRRALRSLAAFPPKLNSFSWEAAQFVADSRDAVVTLRRYSLVEDLAGELRLTMHQTIHDYAIRGNAGDQDAYRRMAEYFLMFISQQKDKQDGAVDPEAWLLALEKEADNIGAALEWAIKYEETLIAYRLMSALWDYWYRRSRYARARGLADRILALKLPDRTDDSRLLRAKLLNDTGNFAYNMADLNQAESCHHEALKIRSELSHSTVSGSLNNLGLVYRERGSYEEAGTYFNKALSKNRAIGKRDWEAINLDNLGINARCRADLDASEKYLNQAASIFVDLSDRWGLAMTQIDHALTLVDRGLVQDAREKLVSSLTDRWGVADQKLSAAALRGLAAVASAEHNSEWSLDLLRASLALSVPILDRLGEHQSLISLLSAYGDVSDHRSVARLIGVLGALRATTGLASKVGERTIAHAVSEARAALGGVFDSLESEGRGAAVTANDVLDVENALEPLLKDVDVEAVVAKAASEASR